LPPSLHSWVFELQPQNETQFLFASFPNFLLKISPQSEEQVKDAQSGAAVLVVVAKVVVEVVYGPSVVVDDTSVVVDEISVVVVVGASVVEVVGARVVVLVAASVVVVVI